MVGFGNIKAGHLYWAAIVIFAVSLILPGFVVQFDPGWPDEGLIWYGYSILFGGWAGILVGQWAWYANVILLGALLAIREKKYRVGIVLSFAGFALGLQTLHFTTFPRNEGGVGDYVISYYGVGYYLWELSFIFLLAYCWAMFRNSRTVSSVGT